MVSYIDLVSPVSARLDYITDHPDVKLSKDEVAHELGHLKMRERVGGVISLSSIILLGLAVFGVLGGGHLIIGALAAIALFSGLYAYVCRQAGYILRNRASFWEGEQKGIEMQEKAADLSKQGS